VEGAAAAVYFSGIAALFPEWAGFQGRNRRPPKDPANSVLSFGYALLLSEAVSAVEQVGLDPTIGVFHTDGDRPSLALDLMEEFRPLLVDTVAIELFTRGRLSTGDFTEDPGSGAVLMTKPAQRVVVAAFEERLLTPAHHPATDKRTTYRRALTLQARQIAQCLTGDAVYLPMRWR
jgi:CRISP-associated protein Cas1